MVTKELLDEKLFLSYILEDQHLVNAVEEITRYYRPAPYHPDFSGVDTEQVAKSTVTVIMALLIARGYQVFKATPQSMLIRVLELNRKYMRHGMQENAIVLFGGILGIGMGRLNDVALALVHGTHKEEVWDPKTFTFKPLIVKRK